MSVEDSKRGGPDLAPGDLRLLADPEYLARSLRGAGLEFDRLERTSARIKAGLGGLVSFRVERQRPGEDALRLAGYVRTGSAPRIRALLQKWAKLAPIDTAFGPGVRGLGDGYSAVFLLPNDAGLRGLRFLTDLDKLKRRLVVLPGFGDAGWRIRGRRSRLEVVRYKPEQRLVAALDLGLRHDARSETTRRGGFLRVFADARGRQVERVVRALRDGGLFDLVPEPWGCLADGHAYVEGRVEGVPLIQASGVPRLEVDDLLAAVARLQEANLPWLPLVTPSDRLARARATADFLAASGGAIGERARALVQQLEGSVPRRGRVVTLHGDLHLRQFVVGANGARLVDFERCVRGHELEDAATLAADACLQARGSGGGEASLLALAEAVEDRCARDRAARDELRWFMAAAFLELALVPVRRCEAEAASAAGRALQLAEDCLRPRSAPARSVPELRWETLHPSRGEWWSAVASDDSGREIPARYEVATGRLETIDPACDPELPGLADWLGRGRLLGYRPGRRAVLAIGEPQPHRFVKVVRPRRAAAIVAAHRGLSAAVASCPDTPQLPRLLAADLGTGVLQLEALAGRSLHEILMSGDEARRREALRAVARAIAALRRVTTDAALPVRDPVAELPTWIDRAERRGREVQEHRALLQEIVARRASAMPPGVLVHGDLHDKNVLLTADGVALLDLDGAGRGAPGDDLGNLMGHVLLRGHQRGEDPAVASRLMLELAHASESHDGARRGSGSTDDRAVAGEETCVVAAATLLRLSCLYEHRRRWRGITPNLLADARLCLALAEGCA